MRLLNTNSLLLESFEGRPLPPYAILSHTWEDDEVRFEDVFSGQSSQVMPTGKQGYIKIKYSCDQAQRDGLEYIWIDTCCIDKSSSAELSEAINSIFNWYQAARRCYVYLFDINRPDYPILKFEESRWFKRGWTLQELIAPVDVEFFDHWWIPLGDKGTNSRGSNTSDSADQINRLEAIFHLDFVHAEDYEGNLAYRIESITRIPIEVLTIKQRPISRLLSRYPAAQRFSWAANRKTARVEDRAYSLLGLFDVNMPLLYGEGKDAFLRLQQEIMKRYHDQTLLAFTIQTHADGNFRGPLADDPALFAHSNIVRVPKPQFSPVKLLEEPLSYSWRHIDLQIYLCPSLSHDQNFALGILDCGYSENPHSRPAILLRRLQGPVSLYHRIEHSILCRISPLHLLNSELVQLHLPWLPESSGGKTVEFDIKKALVATIKLMLGPAFTLNHGLLYTITPPTQLALNSDYILRFAWPRPSETSPARQTAHKTLPYLGESFWLGATSDYDPDRTDLKHIRDFFGSPTILSGLICIGVSPGGLDSTAQPAADTKQVSETYVVLWGLRQQNANSAQHLTVSHGEAYVESAWCYAVAWEDILDPSLAPPARAEEILQVDLPGVLSSIEEFPFPVNTLQEKWTLTRSRPGPVYNVTVQVTCLDFFGEKALQVIVGTSYTSDTVECVVPEPHSSSWECVLTTDRTRPTEED